MRKPRVILDGAEGNIPFIRSTVLPDKLYLFEQKPGTLNNAVLVLNGEEHLQKLKLLLVL
jgi:hypothetical protein